MKLFEFQTPKSVANWVSQDDTVMGGISNSRLRFIGPGHVCFEGVVSLENNGGFAQVKYQKTPFDLSAFEGLELLVKGDNKTYQLRLASREPRVSYAQAFFASSEWQTVRLAFREFEAGFRGRNLPDAPLLDPAYIVSLGFMLGDKQAGSFQLAIAEVKACMPGMIG